MKIRQEKTGRIEEAMDWDSECYLTDKGNIKMIADGWSRLIQHMPRFHKQSRPNVHMNGCMAAPIPRLY